MLGKPKNLSKVQGNFSVPNRALLFSLWMPVLNAQSFRHALGACCRSARPQCGLRRIRAIYCRGLNNYQYHFEVHLRYGILAPAFLEACVQSRAAAGGDRIPAGCGFLVSGSHSSARARPEAPQTVWGPQIDIIYIFGAPGMYW